MERKTCTSCGAELSAGSDLPCPACGVRNLERRVSDTMPLMVDDLAGTTESIREFYEKNPKAKWAVVGFTVISSFVGVLLSGWLGVLAGLILGALAYSLGPLASTKCREIVRTHFK